MQLGWVLPLVPVALAVFFLSALAYYHIQAPGADAEGLLQGMVVGIYRFLGFVPAFMLSLMVLVWGSIWFIGGNVERPWIRGWHLVAFTLSLAVVTNVQPGGAVVSDSSGWVGPTLAAPLYQVLGGAVSTLLAAAAALASLMLATDFLFFRYFDRLARSAPARRGRGLQVEGVENSAVDELRELALGDGDAGTATASGGPSVSGPSVSGSSVSGPSVSGSSVSGPSVSGPSVSGVPWDAEAPAAGHVSEDPVDRESVDEAPVSQETVSEETAAEEDVLESFAARRRVYEDEPVWQPAARFFEEVEAAEEEPVAEEGSEDAEPGDQIESASADAADPWRVDPSESEADVSVDDDPSVSSADEPEPAPEPEPEPRAQLEEPHEEDVEDPEMVFPRGGLFPYRPETSESPDPDLQAANSETEEEETLALPELAFGALVGRDAPGASTSETDESLASPDEVSENEVAVGSIEVSEDETERAELDEEEADEEGLEIEEEESEEEELGEDEADEEEEEAEEEEAEEEEAEEEEAEEEEAEEEEAEEEEAEEEDLDDDESEEEEGEEEEEESDEEELDDDEVDEEESEDEDPDEEDEEDEEDEDDEEEDEELDDDEGEELEEDVDEDEDEDEEEEEEEDDVEEEEEREELDEDETEEEDEEEDDEEDDTEEDEEDEEVDAEEELDSSSLDAEGVAEQTYEIPRPDIEADGDSADSAMDEEMDEETDADVEADSDADADPEAAEEPFQAELFSSGDHDSEAIRRAADLVVDARRASASLLQRRMRVGYDDALSLLDALREEGIVGGEVGEAQGSLLVDPDAWTGAESGG